MYATIVMMALATGGDRVVTGSLSVRPGETAGVVVAVGGSIEVESGGSARDAIAVGGSVHLGPGARVARDVVAVGGGILLDPNARVARDAVSVGGPVRLDAGARVGRNATAVGGTIEQAPGAAVGGDHVSVGMPGAGALLAALGASFLSPLFVLGSALARYIALLVIGLVLLALWPGRIEGLADGLRRSPGLSLLAGLLAAVALPVLGLLLCLTLIGIPLAVLEALLVAFGTAAGFCALGLLLGRALPIGKAPRIQLAAGLALLVIALALPLLGSLFAFFSWLWVFGALLRTRFGRPAPGPRPP